MYPHIPVHDLWWLAAGGGASYGTRYITHKVRTVRAPARCFPAADPTAELLRLQSSYGYNAHSLVSITPGVLTWTMPGIDGAIIYGVFGRVWLAAGEPLGRPEDMKALTEGFMAAAAKARRIAAFVPASEGFARVGIQLGLSAIKIGAAPYFDLEVWQPRGNRAKKLRAGVNRALRTGVRIEIIASPDEDLRKEGADLCFKWLSRRRSGTTFGWLLALDPFLNAERKQMFAARDADDRLVGLLAASPIPARDGWYLEDVLRAPDAPPGTADLLVFAALQQLKAEGAAMATLGTAPLATAGVDELSTHDHPVIERALSLASQRLSAYYNFEGVRRFKTKFVASHWENEYALVQHGVLVPSRVAHALLRAIVPGGLRQLLARRTLRSIGR
jgi:lysylphosphatidylglycerol synthetase-like protein (DUF2156 family)